MKTRKQRVFTAILTIFAVVFMGCPSPDDGGKIPTHVHEWGDWTVTTPATCTEAGVETRVCALDATHKETRPGAAALGHDYSDWVVTTPATYTAAGIETKTCKHDSSHKETRPIPQLSYTSTSVAELGTWLGAQPANTADTAYKIVLNVNDISNIRTTLNAAQDKYVYPDLSGSTIITIPESLFRGSSAPYGTATLTGITIPNTVTSIGGLAFNACTSLTNVTIPNSVTSIGEYAFLSCTSLTEINVDVGNTAYIAENGVLYSKDKTTLILYPAGKTDTSFTILNSVTNIGDVAFYRCTSLTSVTIPNSVTSIGQSAFNNCANLASVTIGNSVSIGIAAFASCTNLTSVTIGNNASIGNQAFRSNPNLTSITFQGSIPSTEFHSEAFFGLGDLRAKFYATNANNGTLGTYTTTAPVGDSSVWTKQ
jgi:hypothetical protein